MSWRVHNNDSLAFPTPNRNRDIYYPSLFRDDRAHPYAWQTHWRPSVKGERAEGPPVHKDVALLSDKAVDSHGDLGWNIEYATAWCYKHLIGNRPDIADAIDRIRDLEDVQPETPFWIFDYLDKALFAGKLKGMVYLRWKEQASSSPGVTSAPGVAKGIARISIELNGTLFDQEEYDTDIDDLLDALIHQMIHAWFLVACGAQPKGAKQDGRLMDGLHFGVIMLTIRDITRECRDGPLDLTFHAAKRREMYGGPAFPSSSAQRYISIDARGGAIGPAPADGQSHCSHDNRKIHVSDIRNWQVEAYSLAMGLDMEAKGDVIYDLGGDQKLVPTDRLKGPPSSTYVELIWAKKRIMVSREKALAFASLRKPLEKDEKMELKLPDCDLEIFSCVYDFITKGMFAPGPAEILPGAATAVAANSPPTGPPVLLPPPMAGVTAPKLNGIITFIRVFHVAETIKFEELLRYALKRLYDLQVTYDDPIAALKELYDTSSPIHAELHKWARKFLLRREDAIGSRYDVSAHTARHHATAAQGMTNYAKLLTWHSEAFHELYYRCPAFKDDCKIVGAELRMGGDVETGPPAAILPRHHHHQDPLSLAWPASSSAAHHPLTAAPSTSLLPNPVGRTHSFSHLDPLDLMASSSSAPYWLSPHSHHNNPLYADDLLTGHPSYGTRFAPPPPLLDWDRAASPAFLPFPAHHGRDAAYNWVGRDGRLKVKNRVTGQTWVREI